jgi:glycogen debranching enzyme
MPVFAPIPPERAKAIADRIAAIGDKVRYVVPSHDPDAKSFDARRYWRGPVWLVVNFLIADGLRRAGQEAIADKVVEAGLDLIFSSGFAEYYDPLDGTACGGGQFTWTAATVLEFIDAR